MLSQARAYLREKGLSVETEETVEEKLMEPWVEGLVRSGDSKLTFKKATRKATHINILETKSRCAALVSEPDGVPSRRILIGADSRVQLGALAKGRSSANSLNFTHWKLAVHYWRRPLSE